MVCLLLLALIEQIILPLSSTGRTCTKLFNLVHSNSCNKWSAKPSFNWNVLIIIPWYLLKIGLRWAWFFGARKESVSSFLMPIVVRTSLSGITN